MSARGPRRAGGFTLLEVVLALGLLAIGATAVLSLFSFGALMSDGARTRVEAATALEVVVARVEEGLFPLLPDGSVGPAREVADEPVPGYPGLTWSVEVQAEPGPPPLGRAPRLHKVRVTVRWRTDGRGQSLTKVLAMPQAVPFGARLRQRLAPGAEPPRLSFTEPPDASSAAADETPADSER